MRGRSRRGDRRSRNCARPCRDRRGSGRSPPRRPDVSDGPIVFDAYGTLFDPAALAGPLERRFPGRGSALASAWRATQLRHTWLRALMGATAWADFDTVTRVALEQTLDGAGLPADDVVTDELLARYRTLPAYPDVVEGLT